MEVMLSLSKKSDGIILKKLHLVVKIVILFLLIGSLEANAATKKSCIDNCFKVAPFLDTKSPIISDDWEWQNMGLIGVDPNALAPNNSGLTFLQCYLQGINPQQIISENPVNISIAATGPFRAPADISLIVNIVHPQDKTIAHIDFYNGTRCFLTQPNPKDYSEVKLSQVPENHYIICAKAYDTSESLLATTTTEFDVVPSNRYNRGLGDNQDYISSVIALDNQRGDCLDKIGDFTSLYGTNYPWFLRAASDFNQPCISILNPVDYPVNNPNQSRAFQVNNLPSINEKVVGGEPPMVAFGSGSGHGTSLFINKDYHFGIISGRPQIVNALKIDVYEKSAFESNATNVTPVVTQVYDIPSPADRDSWAMFQSQSYVQDYHLLTNINNKAVDFDTQLQLQFGASDVNWGNSWTLPVVLTHRSANDLFYYKISFQGDAPSFDETHGISLRPGEYNYNISYTLDFSEPAPWSTTILTVPQFQGSPVPSGVSIDELLHPKTIVQDSLTPPSDDQLIQFKQLNNSPEFKSHPLLDQLVNDYGNNPIALANYVQNEIELTDAIGYNTTGNVDPYSINSQGVTRDALAVLLEGQGSPIEQCALLIYLLRKIGVPAVYIFPEYNQTYMYDEQLSKMLHMQLRGETLVTGMPLGTPEFIPINYPWVAAYVNNKWVHLFPWIKDTQVTEGEDLWNYFPNGYKTGAAWLKNYLLNDPTIRSLSKEDNPGTLFPLYAEQQLKENNLSLSDVGIRFLNQKHNYKNWNDFPRPWATPLVSSNNITSSLSQDFFDTINIKVFSDRNGNGVPDDGEPILQTGDLRFVDLHDRRLLLYHQIIPGTTPPQYNMILSLEAYDSTPGSSDLSTSYTFTLGDNTDPGNLRASQKISTTLLTATDHGDINDDAICYQISCTHHKQAANANHGGYPNQPNLNDFPAQLPGLGEIDTIVDNRPLRKGDMAVLSLDYGRVTKEMQNFEFKKYLDYQRRIQADPTMQSDPELATGQLLQIIGKTYYHHVGQFQQQLEELTKMHSVSFRAHGLVKFSPEYGEYGPVTSVNNGKLDFNLLYPRVDMSFQRAVSVGNASTHLDSGADEEQSLQNTGLLMGEVSAQEHRVINEFFNQVDAVSTVKLLDLAEGWTPETGVASAPGTNNILVLTANNYMQEEVTSMTTYSSATSLSGFVTMWNGIINFFKNHANDPTATVFLTPQPITASSQGGIPYTGMGAFSLSLSDGAAWITDRMNVNNGGYGGMLNVPIYSNNPDVGENTITPLPGGGFAFSQYSAGQPSPSTQNYTSPAVAISHFNSISNQINSGHQSLMPDVVGSLALWNSATSQVVGANLSQPTLANTGSDIAALWKSQMNGGNIGNTAYYGERHLNFVMDPVSVVTGEFYLNDLDLKLEGPMPLEIRRIYGSQNLSDNNFGNGWRLGYFPYLMLSVDATETTPPSLIYAAETDGSVIAYRYQPDQKKWEPQASDNPTLINAANGEPGSSKNLFNNFITQTTVDGLSSYILKASDGSLRSFKVKSFPIIGSTEITRTRPYLEKWSDANGNFYSFSFGTNNMENDFGELNAITSSNGTSLHFHYDPYRHITDAFSNDGRHLKYDYDNYGDLVKVTLPDNSQISYSYDHQNTLDGTTGAAATTYSTHLLTQINSPSGRILKNDYDAQRRVITQYATVGTSVTPVQTASFNYSVTAANPDNTGNGTTIVTDVNGNPTIYTINGNQITGISYPANGSGITPQISQTWTSSATMRALASRTDRRGLTTSYTYDPQGNLTSRTLVGNLTGNGSGETATTTYSYNSNNLLTSVTDQLGNGIAYAYNDPTYPYNPTSIIKSASGKTTSTTALTYQAFGLIASSCVDGATTSYSYDSHGFFTSIKQATGTHDPDVVTTIECDNRGEIVSETDSLGQKKKYDYDAMGRRTFDQTFDATGSLIDWHAQYYNENGDITWQQGARFNPVDYTYYDYDRSGNLIHKASWLSRALPDASGVITDGLAATAYSYDAQGNCTSITDPNGHVTTMTYDALGEMISRTSGDGMASEAFTYDPQGSIASHTTVLGGVENNSYTSTGLIQSASHADGTVTGYRYDLSGRLVEEILPNGSRWKISYDGNNITRTFLNSGGAQIASEQKTYDGRGNLILSTDRAGNSFTATYDGLNRIKTEQGPAGSSPQQTITHIYQTDFEATVNGAGERTNKFYDALGRPILTTVFNSDGSIASNVSNWYSADHQSILTTVGSGSNAIATTTFTDLQNRPLILKHADGSAQINVYDENGNKTIFRDEEGNVNQYTYDALNHLSSTILPGGAVITTAYNAAGELVSRSMPQCLVEQNSYNQAGQKISDALVGSDGAVTRNHTYTYAFGDVATVTDPRGFTTYMNYDAWQHLINSTSSGSVVPEQNQTTTYNYDPRGYMTSVAQKYNDPSTGPSTVVSRAYDAYGQLASETTSINGTNVSAWQQSWNQAGRRTSLNWSLDNQGKGAQYAFNYNALGLLTSAQNASGTCSYAYADSGLLFLRTTPAGKVDIKRDGEGNIVNETLQDGSQESISYRGDGKIQSYSIVGPSGNETRNYVYDVRGRLTQEPYTLTASPHPDVLPNGTQMAQYLFDENPLLSGTTGVIDGLGIRTTQCVNANTKNCVGSENSFAQVLQDYNLPGNGTNEIWTSSYDAAGEVIKREVIGTKTQNLTWDSFGRLVKVSQRNSDNQGYNWSTIYDGLGRRIQTAYADATDNQTTSAPLIINYYYDPEIEFMEIGRDYYGRAWSLFGPDRSGIYGGAQGIGGLEMTVAEGRNEIHGIVNNLFGDILGITTGGSFTPWGVVLGGYGAMLGSSVNADLVPQWRTHYLDWTGFYYMGARYYEPNGGRFLSADPMGHDASLSLYDYCDGDPVNGLDPDGRNCGKNQIEGGEGQARTQNPYDPKYAPYILQSGESRSLYPFGSFYVLPAQIKNRNQAIGGYSHVRGTIFSGPYDSNDSAYTGKPIDPDQLGAALPFRFQNSRKQLPNVYIKITSQATGQSTIVPIVDVGPHGIDNPYWNIPNGDPTSGDKRNKSGLDMTPATGRALGLPVSKGSHAHAPAFKTSGDEYFNFEFIP